MDTFKIPIKIFNIYIERYNFYTKLKFHDFSASTCILRAHSRFLTTLPQLIHIHVTSGHIGWCNASFDRIGTELQKRKYCWLIHRVQVIVFNPLHASALHMGCSRETKPNTVLLMACQVISNHDIEQEWSGVKTIDINMLINCLKIIKMYSHFASYLGFHSTEKDQINNEATLYVVYPILSIPCLLMLWRLKEPGHQHAWYWSPKPEYSVSNMRRVNQAIIFVLHMKCNKSSFSTMTTMAERKTAVSPVS